MSAAATPRSDAVAVSEPSEANPPLASMTSQRFGFNPEFAARMAKRHYKIIEVPISYYPRTKAQGKKIGLKDGLESLWVTIKYNLFTK